MTNPFDDSNRDANNGQGPNDNGQGSNNSGPENNPYQPTNHPEDRPGYGQGQNQGGGLPSYGDYSSQQNQGGFGDNGYGQGGYGQDGYGQGGYGAAGYQEGAPGYGGYAGYDQQPPAYQPTKPSAIDALKWGFKTTFSNAKLWILGALAFFAVSFGVAMLMGVPAAIQENNGQAGTAVSVLNILSMIVSMVLALLVMRLALFQVDDPRTAWNYLGKNIPWLPTIGVEIVISIIGAAVVMVPMMGILAATVGMGAGGAEPTEEDVFAAVGTVFGILFVMMLIMFFIQPLIMFMSWAAIDGKGFTGAFKVGFNIGKNNYGQLLVFLLLNFVCGIGILITLGLGAIVIGPALMLGQAHLYRQCTGGPVPAA